jgi:hypothetical protein
VVLRLDNSIPVFCGFSPALLLTLAVPVFYRSISEYLPLANFVPFSGFPALLRSVRALVLLLRRTVLQTPNSLPFQKVDLFMSSVTKTAGKRVLLPAEPA